MDSWIFATQAWLVQLRPTSSRRAETRYCAGMQRFLHAVAIWVLILGVAGVSIYVPHRANPKDTEIDLGLMHKESELVGADEAHAMKPDTQEAESESEPFQEEHVSSSTELRGRLLVVARSMAAPATATTEQDLVLGDAPLDQLASAIVMVNFGMKAEAGEQIDLAAKGFDSDSGDSVDKANDKASDAALLNATSAVVNAWPASDASARPSIATESSSTLAQAAPPTKEQFELLQQRLGWFGTFAQAKISADEHILSELQESDLKFMLVLGVAALWFMGFGASGIAALITLIVMGLTRKIGSAITSRANTSLILGETFVAWFVLFLGLQFAAMVVPVDPESPWRLALSGALMFAALGALAWARWRGLSMGAIMDLTGLRWNQGFFQLLWKAAISYVTALPLMGLGLLIGLGMGWFFNVPNLGNPSHPIQELIDKANPMELFMLFALACVAAPITEEIIFRGVLYGHLRQGTSKWGVVASMIFSMVISGTIFAGIHPQGAFVAPALAGLACAFCITREWSGSVFPGMIAHGIQNATVLALNVVLFQM
jgi:membrane protease YdiL (CAAX protease family)